MIGHPIAHSLSPTLHRAAYAQLGLDWSYEAIDLEPDRVDAFVASLAGSHDDPLGPWRGLSVTMPHKEAILRHGVPDEASVLAGCANTLVVAADGNYVFNTDVTGFVAACRRAAIEPRDAVLAGAGATARAVMVALSRLGVTRVTVLARRPEAASGLLDLAHRLGMEASVERLGQVAPATGLLVSTVPADGLAEFAGPLAAAAAAVFDVSYHPWPTPLARAASGKPLLGGLDLLAHQAVDQVTLMTGREIGVDVLLRAGRRQLGRNAEM